MLTPWCSVTQIVSHSTHDRMELPLSIWLENAFIQSGALSCLNGLCGEIIECEDGGKVQVCVCCLCFRWLPSLYPVSFRRTKGNGIWIVPPGVFRHDVCHDVFRGSVNRHNVSFSRNKTNMLFLAWRLYISQVVLRKGFKQAKRLESSHTTKKSDKWNAAFICIFECKNQQIGRWWWSKYF